MAKILCIETGSDVCSVALAEDGELIGIRESEGRDHSRKLALYVDEMLKESDLEPLDLDAIAVGKGPGSYTGLRIGVSFAKGMCYSLGIPLIGVGSLEALAHVAIEEHQAKIWRSTEWRRAKLCPMIDARRMEVYAQVFDSGLVPLSEVGAHIIESNSFEEFIDPDGEFIIFGDGADKCVDILPKQGVRFIDIAQSARGLVAPATRMYQKSQFEDTAYFEPYYLKDFVVIPSNKKPLSAK